MSSDEFTPPQQRSLPTHPGDEPTPLITWPPGNPHETTGAVPNPPPNEGSVSQRQQDELAFAQEALVLAQRNCERLENTLRELGTPVLPIFHGILVLPLIGQMDAARSGHLIDDLLSAIQQHQADVVLVDITGVPTVDTAVAGALLQATRAAGMLGTTCVLVGVTAAVSQTLVGLGISLGGVPSQRDLQAGFAMALKMRGYRIQREKPEIDWLSDATTRR
jgi:anti-anti-sigma regulatory factor